MLLPIITEWPKGRDRGDFTKDCSEKGMTTFEKVAESNRIEGIDRAPTAEELVEHDRVMELENLTIRDLENFVNVYQRNAKLRVNPGMDVRVGSYVPPKGGEHIREMLGALLHDINCDRIDAWNAHVQYESIHPFTDGNGRSARVVYHWQMSSTRMADLGFLHAFYYQTLRNYQTPPKNLLDSWSFESRADRGDDRGVVGCPEKTLMKQGTGEVRGRLMNVLYLDFDNVLHGDVLLYPLQPETPGQILFENMPILEQLLEPYPDLKLVLSTSWVQQLAFARARKALPPSLRKRVIDATYQGPHMREEEFSRLTRYEQVIADVARRRPGKWLAIDYDLDGWPEHALINVVPMSLLVGLGDAAVALELKQRLEKVFGNVEKFLIHPDLVRNAKVEWPDVDLDK